MQGKTGGREHDGHREHQPGRDVWSPPGAFRHDTLIVRSDQRRVNVRPQVSRNAKKSASPADPTTTDSSRVEAHPAFELERRALSDLTGTWMEIEVCQGMITPEDEAQRRREGFGQRR